MSSFLDKLLHFGVGLAIALAFWSLVERYARFAARQINPIVFLVMLVWGASGLFFFRKLGIPLLSHTFFYMAFPDWDIPIYNATGLRFLIHRSWLFHSVLIPMALGGIWLWLGQKHSRLQTSQYGMSRMQRFGMDLLRDAAIGLSVGVSAHLIWDALLSSTRRGFYIHGFDRFSSFVWLLLNLAVGLGVPFLLTRYALDVERRPVGDD